MRTVAKQKWFRGWLAGTVVLAAGCFTPDDIEPARVAPFDLVMDNRVVLTPGHQVTLDVEIRREAPTPPHPVKLALSGGGGDGVTVTLDKKNTKDDVATLTITASETAPAQEVAYALDGKLAYETDHEPLVVSVQVPSQDISTEEYAPGVTGVVKSLTINGSTITYEVINGLAILGGDMVLGDAATFEARAKLRSATCNPNFHTDFACASWTDGVIGYSFANDWGDDAENARMRGIIDAAMREWTRQTGIQFVPRTSGEHIQFRNGSGCSSGVGRVVFTGFDVQSVSLSNAGCDNFGIVLHEIGHAIGLYHEQMRNDRDSYVVVDFGRVKEDKLSNFFQIGSFLVDRGPYNYDSIMHYEPWAFAKNATTCKNGLAESPPNYAECTVYPTNPPTARIGQRSHLSEGDIYGAYQLYPPVFDIVGATPGQTSDRFNLRLVYERGRPQVDRVEWTSDRVATPLGTGNEITIRASDVAPGTNVITARFIVANKVIRSRSISLQFANDAPVVSLQANNGLTQQHMGQVFTVVATVNDTEEGSCENCTFTWNPAPTTGPTDARFASFKFDTPGPQTIELTVEDRGGATTTATLTVDIVNTAPTVTIVLPSPGLVVPSGTFVSLHGRADDINSSTGTLPCTQLRWSSSNPSDNFFATLGCHVSVQLFGAGTRTITLTASDGYASAVPATLDITVNSCSTGGCPPTAFIELPAPPVPGVYFVDRPLEIWLRLGDIDHDEPITYILRGRRVGESATFTIATGSVSILDQHSIETATHSWTPSTNVGTHWFDCANSSQYRDYELLLEATDSSGATTTHTRVVTLGCDLI